jgi:crotonobetainyl-CoA:carnitine CoA-transferase CaiB-like acyl-CoA transferase
MVGPMGGLQGLKVVDLGLGMAAALVAKYLVETGASVTRVEPPGGDPFYEHYPAYGVWRRGLTVDEQAGRSEAGLKALLASADVCIVGGEDHPAVVGWRRPANELQSLYPKLVILDIQGYPSHTRHTGRPATDILVQARSGLSFEHYNDRPLLMSFEPTNYGAALQGLTALFAALFERERSGLGQIAYTSMYEGALMWALYLWVEAERPTPASNFVMPKDPWPLIFKCADGTYIQVVLGSAGSKGRLYQILEINDPTVDINDSGMPKPTADSRNFFGDIDLLAAHIARRNRAELLEAIWNADLPAEPVLPPGGGWEDPQVLHNGIIVRDPDGIRHVGHPVSVRLSSAPRKALPAPGSGPLSGVTVIDFGAFVAGPYTSIALGDLGASVIKVEAVTGDPNRSVFRAFTSVNRGKRVIALDLKSQEGRDIARQLCKNADVAINNFKTGVSARLGIDAKSLHEVNPNLIVLESAAYGSSGPKAERPGFDMVFQAFCGHEYRAGGVGNPPLWNRTSMVDYAGGMLGAVAILQQLYQRARSGCGAELGIGLLNAGIFLLSELIALPDGRFTGAPPLNHDRSGYRPAEQMYEAADGWIAIAARDEASARRLLDVLGLRDTVTRPAAEWGEEEGKAIASAIRRRPLAELPSLLEAAGVWAEICRRDVEHAVLHDPDLVSAGTVYCSQHPNYGQLREIGPLYRFSRSRRAGSGHAPLRGQHTRELLAELGYDGAAIEGLYIRKVVA